MRTIMARTPHDSSLSVSKRHLQWATRKVATGADAQARRQGDGDGDEVEDASAAAAAGAASSAGGGGEEGRPAAAPKKRAHGAAVSRFRAAFTAAIAASRLRRSGAGGGGGGLGSRVTGTLFGRRRGHVHFAFQADPRACPALLIELATPTSGLVREMASGLVRIALECERRPHGAAAADGAAAAGGKRRLLEEPLWRTYCNGKKCGFAVRRECGPADWRVLRAVEPVSMGAGVLPAASSAASAGDGEEEGEMMYMRARFERVVGSRDSEAFYMMSPDGNGGPELSIYLLRV